MNIEPQSTSHGQMSRRSILQLSGAAVAVTGLALPSVTPGSSDWDKLC